MTAGSLSVSGEATFPCRFGEYVLVTHLGEGGMGRVYAALTPGGELCVVKRFGNPRAPLPAHLLEENKARFLREAEISKALRHPGIARTYASVHDGLHSYLVQEFVPGMTLDYFMGAFTSSGPSLPIAMATFIAMQIADALAYLHDFEGMGLIHRDLSATNIMLSQTGDVKVIDFGIAKATLAEDNLTDPNLVVGKPLWTAPEVRQGGRPDRRTDLYALGLLYWYLLSGEDPTDHLDEKPTSELPAPSKFRSEITAEIDELALQAVHVDPNLRFQNARAFLDAIAHFLPDGYHGASELGPMVRSHQLSSEDEFFAELVSRARRLVTGGWRRRFRFAVLVAVSGALVLAVGGFVVLGHRSDDRPVPTRPQPTSAIPGGPAIPFPATIAPPSAITPPPLPPAPPLQPEPPSPARLSASAAQLVPPSAALRSPSRPRIPLNVEPSPRPQQQHQQVASPADPQALLDSANDAAAGGDNARALRLARASVSAQPSAEAYVLVARLSWSDKAAARVALESALRLSPGNAQATKLLRSLDHSAPPVQARPEQ